MSPIKQLNGGPSVRLLVLFLYIKFYSSFTVVLAVCIAFLFFVS